MLEGLHPLPHQTPRCGVPNPTAQAAWQLQRCRSHKVFLKDAQCNPGTAWHMEQTHAAERGENKKSPLMAALSLVNTNFESIKLQPLQPLQTRW